MNEPIAKGFGFGEPRFLLRWRGYVKEDGTELPEKTVAKGKTLKSIRQYARIKGFGDSEYRIDEIGSKHEVIDGRLFMFEEILNEYQINK